MYYILLGVGGLLIVVYVSCGWYVMYTLGGVVKKMLTSSPEPERPPRGPSPQRSTDESKLLPLEDKMLKVADRVGRLESTCVGFSTQMRSMAGTISVIGGGKQRNANDNSLFDTIATKEETVELRAAIEALQFKVDTDRRTLSEMRTSLELLRQGGASGHRRDNGATARQTTESSDRISSARETTRAGQAAGDDNESRWSRIDEVVEAWNRSFQGGAEFNDETFLALQRRTGWSYSVFPHNTDLVICYHRRANGQQPVVTVLARIGAMANFVGEHYFEKARDSGPKAKVLRVLRHATLRPMDDEKFRDLLDGKGMFGEMGSLRAYVQEKGEVDVES